MQSGWESRRVNFWTIYKATDVLDGFADFSHAPVMKILRQYRDLVEFSIERDGNQFTIHIWGPNPAMKRIIDELAEISIEASFPDDEDVDEARHISISWA